MCGPLNPRFGMWCSLRPVALFLWRRRLPVPRLEDLSLFPPLYNDPYETEQLAEQFRLEFGNEQVLPGSQLMGSEGFGALGAAIGVPSVYWFFGGNDSADRCAPGQPLTILCLSHGPESSHRGSSSSTFFAFQAEQEIEILARYQYSSRVPDTK